MKTPDEIKKGLAACSADECHGEHKDCPYQESVFCIMKVCGNALAYIQQLEDRNEKLENALRNLANSSSNARDKANEVIEHLKSLLAQVERQRDAAVDEIKRMEGKAKELFETEIHDVILRELPYSDYMDFINQVEQICNYQFEREWRGVCPENTKEKKNEKSKNASEQFR